MTALRTQGHVRTLLLAPLIAFMGAGCYSFEPFTAEPASLPQPVRVPRVRLLLSGGGAVTTRPEHLVRMAGTDRVTYIHGATHTVLHTGTVTTFTGILPDSLVLSALNVQDPAGKTAGRWYLRDSTMIQADTGSFVVVLPGVGPGFFVRAGQAEDGEKFRGFIPDSSITAVEQEQISPVRSVVFGAIIAAAVGGMVVAMDRMHGWWVGGR